MMRRFAAALCCLAGCGPNLSQLVADHHYREAICGAQDGSRGDREVVGAALEADAGLAVHVAMVPTAQLEPLLGDQAVAMSARGRFARISLQINALPVDGVSPRVAITAASGRTSAPVAWDALLRITGEERPPNRTGTSYATGRNLLAILTLGMTIPFTGLSSRTVEVPPPDDDYRTTAPRAYALFQAMARTGCDWVPAAGDRQGWGQQGRQGQQGQQGVTCRAFVAIAPGTETAELTLSLAFWSQRKTWQGADLPETCTVERTVAVPLGRLDELDATTVRMFGARMRSVADLASARWR